MPPARAPTATGTSLNPWPISSDYGREYQKVNKVMFCFSSTTRIEVIKQRQMCEQFDPAVLRRSNLIRLDTNLLIKLIKTFEFAFSQNT